MVVNLSYFMPLFAFLFVFVIVYALLGKTKILGESTFVNLLISFILATVFVVSPAATEFTSLALPWIAAFIVSLVFILLVLGFVGGKMEDIMKSPLLAKIVIGILVLIFLIAGIKVFGPIIGPYLPGSETSEAEGVKFIILHPAVIGALALLIIGAIVSWVLTKEE